MHRVVVVALLVGGALPARAEDSQPPLDPLTQGWRQQRREAIASGAVAGAGAFLLTLGGVLAGARDAVGGGADGSDLSWRVGLGFVGLGGALLIPTMFSGTYAAGHAYGLRLVPVPPQLDAQHRSELLARLDVTEVEVRRRKLAGIILFAVGAVLTGAGAAMAVIGVGDICIGREGGSPPCRQGNNALFGFGTAISVIGEISFYGGAFTWAHSAGAASGLADTRRFLSLTPTGLAGSF